MYTVRTYKGIINELRKFFIKNRNGIVLENIKTNDLDELVLNMEICMEQMGIANRNYINKPICIKTDVNTYTIIFMIKDKKEHLVNLYQSHKLGDGITTFQNWFSKNIKESVG